jgi:hypothetical protein
LILDVLNRARLNFSERDLLVLAQPEFDDAGLYWKSIEDFLHFTAAIAGERSHISGHSLLQLFDKAKPSIMKVKDFSNPSIPFETILQNVTTEYLNNACDFGIERGIIDIQKWLATLNSGDLRRGLDVHFIGDVIVKCTRIFETKAEELFPHLLEYSPEQTRESRESIKTGIETIGNQLFVDLCIAIVVPEIECEIVEKIKQDIGQEINQIPVANLGTFPFATLSFRREQEIESRFQQLVLLIHRSIPESSEFPMLIKRLKEHISGYVKEMEITKRQEYSNYIQQEIEKERAAREEQFKSDLTTMQRTEAEKRMRLEEERSEIERQRKEEASRHESEFQQNQSLLEAQLAQQQEHNQLMLQLQERSSRERDQLFQMMLNHQQEAEARASAQYQAELQLRIERDKALQQQIEQLASREPTIIQIPDRPQFPWEKVIVPVVDKIVSVDKCNVF